MKERKRDLVFMNRKALALITLLSITLLLVASIPSMKAATEAPQTQWEKTYGPVEGYSVVQTDDGGYAIVGYEGVWQIAPSHGYGDWVNVTSVLIKIDASGAVQWRKAYGNETDSEAGGHIYSAVQTVDGGYALAGSRWDKNLDIENYTNFWLVKTDAEGNVQWSRTYLSPEHNAKCAVIQTKDEGYALAGYTQTSGGRVDAWLVKTDKQGNILWNITSTVSDFDLSVVEATDGGLVIAGTAKFSEGSFHIWDGTAWALKASHEGVMLWNRTYEDYAVYGPQSVRSIANTRDGGYLIAGLARSPPDAANNNAFLIKLDSNGAMQWTQIYERETGIGFTSAIQTTDGGYIATGSTLAPANASIIKTDAYGNVEWSKTYGGYGSSAKSIIATSDGGYAFTGLKDEPRKDEPTFTSESKIWLVKIEPDSGPQETTPPPSEPPEFFYATWIVIAVVIVVAVLGLGLLVYFRKRKH